MDEFLYSVISKYFNRLHNFGYIKYPEVYKVIVIDYIQELLNSYLTQTYTLPTSKTTVTFFTEEDYKIMDDVMYSITGSSCLVSEPYKKCPCVKADTSVPAIPTFTTNISSPVYGRYDSNVGEISSVTATLAYENSNKARENSLAITLLPAGSTSAQTKTLVSGAALANSVSLGAVSLLKGTNIFQASVVGTDKIPYYSAKCNVIVDTLSDGMNYRAGLVDSDTSIPLEDGSDKISIGTGNPQNETIAINEDFSKSGNTVYFAAPSMVKFISIVRVDEPGGSGVAVTATPTVTTYTDYDYNYTYNLYRWDLTDTTSDTFKFKVYL